MSTNNSTSDNTLRILDRVKKMMALANDRAASEGERDNAIRMAYNTLAKYNLSMAQVGVLDSANNDPRAHVILDLAANEPWTLRAASGVAALFFCKHFRNSTINGHMHCFVGKSVNTQTASYMAEYVIGSIRKEADSAAANYFGNFKLDSILGIDSGETPESGKKLWIESFRIGAAAEVNKRCLQLAADAQRDNSQGTGTSLVLASLYQQELAANADYIKNQMGIHLSSIKAGAKALATGAAAAGAKFGGSINLSRQIGAGATTLRIGKK